MLSSIKEQLSRQLARLDTQLLGKVTAGYGQSTQARHEQCSDLINVCAGN